tara:strand:+ start:4258 stop:5940 length:1683 start_codon:yes stop_codon:yes gene_type:complete
MRPARVLGVANTMSFPDDMSDDEIRAFLQQKFNADTIKRATGEISDALAPQDDIAAPYKPSLMEKAGQGIADVLSDTGVISNRAGAQQIGKNVTAIGELLPGIGDVAAVDDTIRAYNKGNYGEAALNAVGVVPLLGDAAIFAGVLAKNADLGALRKAKLLEDTGAGRNRIWKETGWANDNGDWKFEIDDSQAQLTEKALKQSIVNDKGDVLPYKLADNGRFRDYVDQPHLAASYPELTSGEYRNIAGEGGSHQRLRSDILNKDYSEISVGRDQTPKDRLSTSLHELQHGIQSTEGFIGGGAANKRSVELAKKQITENLAPISEAVNKIEASPEYMSRLSELREQGYRKSGARIIADKEFGLDNLNKKLFSQTPLEKAVYDKDAGNYNAYESYKRLGGEAEARNVQTRMNMTPDERRAKPPWETLDVPEDELIYRGGSGVSKNQASVDVASSIKPADGKTKDVLKSKYPDLKIGVSETADNIILDKVVVPDKSKGTGTKFMNDLIADADSKGKSIGLTPSSDFGGNKKRLTEFYKRFGFVENKGKNKDFTISESMIRPIKP